MSEELWHYGTLHKSGRYPWGSGDNPNQRNKQFLDYVNELKRKGLSESEIAKGMGMTTTQLRANKAIAKKAERKQLEIQAQRLKDTGMSTVAVGKEMGLNESSVRDLLNPAKQERNSILETTANMLKDQVAEKKYLDIGLGTENHLGVSGTQLSTAVEMLTAEGYVVHKLKIQQQGTGKYTEYKVLVPKDVDYKELINNQDKIQTVAAYSEDGGRSYLGLETPKNIDSKRIKVRYAEEGGSDMDGVIQVRRGVDDVSLGGNRYAQVRIAVDGSHYLKGMAMYTDDLPDGVDLIFNTNKSNTGNKLDAMKKLKDDPDNPFGSVVRQRHYTDKDGNKQLSAMNIVNEEGDWYNWSRSLSSQMLSKQSHNLAKDQLGLSFDIRKAEYDEIMSLTNPAVRQHLLEKFADGADSAAVRLKAAGLPKTRNHVILPITDMSENEIYAPNYRNGDKVVLIRHPHAGPFEIPELTVNNRHKTAKSILDNSIDAVGIHPKVAEKLSGADFDGDSVLVIPNDSRKIKTAPTLIGLKDFDPKREYPGYEGMKSMSSRTKQLQMGQVSNLITDMTIRGATNAELARAVRHSMVVIDAEKHNLNWKESERANGILELKRKYQGRPDKPNAGASTLISRAKSEERVPNRKPRSAKNGGPIDPETGKKMWEYTNESYTDKHGKVILRKTPSTKMAETDDAFTLIDPDRSTPMEEVYATHANKLKALANSARKASYETKTIPYSPSAKAAYSQEVASLTSKLNVALKNKPLERRAQTIANTIVKAKIQANPDMEPADLKKIKGMALREARSRTNPLGRTRIDITPREWEAIQAGAITNNRLNDILDNTDLDRVKALATPRLKTVMVPAKVTRAKSMLAAGYTQSEIAEALGVSTSTLHDSLNETKG